MQKSAAKLWFDFLREADRMGLDVNWDFYAPWGTPVQIRSCTFEAWWRERGKSLLDESVDQQMAVEKIRDGRLRVTIPANWTVRRIREEIGPLISPFLSNARVRGKREFVIKGRYSYKDFRKYLKVLQTGVPTPELVAEKVPIKLALKEMALDEQLRINRANLATETSASKAISKGKKRYKKFRAATMKNPSARNGYLWRRRGVKIAENVAKGIFPGNNRS